MKQIRNLRKGLAMLLAIAMVVGPFPNAGVMKVSAETGTSESVATGTVTFTAKEGTSGASTSEGYAMLIDGKYTESDGTKWCVTGFSSTKAYIIFEASEPVSVDGYSIVTGDDNAANSGRNPKSWTLYGCNDEAAGKDSTSWEKIDAVTNDSKLEDKNYTIFDFSVKEPTDVQYKYFKLEITAIRGYYNTMQMSEFILDYSTCVHTWEETDTTFEPTCTEDGYNVKKCSLCQRTRNVANGTSAKGHSWADKTVVEPTCTKGGYTLQNCSVCSAEQKVNIKNAKGHTWVKTDETIDPTCTKGGYDVEKCSSCQVTRNVANGTSAKGHSWAHTDETIEPTCTEGGYDVEKCSSCQVTRNIANDTPANGHTFVFDKVVAPTCQKKGYTLNKCSACQAEQRIDATDTIPHNYVDGICSVCSVKEAESQPIQDENDAYEIKTTDELYWFAGLVNGTLASGKKNSSANAVLAADITINNNVLNTDGTLNESGTFREWTPIGTSTSNTYAGTFDGKGHTVSGLYFNNRTSGTKYVGLFGRVGLGGKISRVGVMDSYLCGYDYVGGVCGLVINGTIENCFNTGTVDGDQSVGGVCGNNNTDGIIKNCYSTGVASGNISVGGVCGINYNQITDCYFDNTVCKNNAIGTGGSATNVEGKTTEQFKRGEVCYLLNNAKNDGSQIWYQNIDKEAATADAYPVIAKDHGTVYQCTNCTGIYSNTENKRAEHTLKYTADDEENTITVTCGYCNGVNGSITLSAPTENLDYDGNVKVATVSNDVTGVTISNLTITYKKVTVQGDKDLGTSAPVDAGTYTASITLGTGEGAATVSVTYTIIGEVASVGTVPTAKNNLTYNGKAQKLVNEGSNVTGGTLQYSTSRNGAYSTTIPTGTDAKAYSVWYMVVGQGGYSDSEPVEIKVKIAPLTITNNTTITLGSPLTYNKAEQTQTVASVNVQTGDNQLKLAASDYYVTGAAQTDAGTYTLTVIGKGNFTGNAKKDFSIAKAAAPKIADVNKKYCYAAGSAGNTETIDINALLPADKGETTYVLADNEAAYVTGEEVSNDGKLTYKVGTLENYNVSTTLTVTATSNNYENITVNVIIGIIDKNATVEKATAKVAVVGSNVLTYGQKLSTLTLNKDEAVFVEENNATPVTGTLDWTTPDAVLDAGTTEAEWTFKPSDNTHYKTLTGKLTIVVEQAEPNVEAFPTVANRTFHPTTKLSDITLEGGNVLDVNGTELTGTWSWKTADVIPTVENSGYEAVFTPNGADKDNYKTVSKTITVPVTKATPYIKTKPTAAALTYGQTLVAATLTGGSVQYSSEDDTMVAGTFAWKVDTTKPTVADSEKTTYKVVFTPENNNYDTVETDITITVNKAECAPNKPDNTLVADFSKEKVSDITTLPEGWVWKDVDKDKALTVGTPAIATAVYTGEDAGNYEVESVAITITIQKCVHATTEIRDLVASTCTVKGYTGDTYCKVCGEKVDTGQVIDELGHNLQQTAAKIEATCTTAGKEAVMGCSRCNHTEGGATIAALGHEFAADFTVDKEATCTEAGSKSKHCSRCDAKSEVTEIAKDTSKHGETEVKDQKAATCTEKGYSGDTYCKACGAKTASGTEINTLDHDYAASFTIDKEATCTEAGSKSKHCSHCNAKSEVTEISAAGHKWNSGKITKQPTETATGVKTYTCIVCGKNKTEVIPKKKATTPKSPKKGDVVADDKASAKVKVTDVKKKEVAYENPVNKKAKSVTIPTTVKIYGVTYKVTKIADNAFKNNKTVNKVTVGSNITTIGKYAFSGATKLNTIKLGKNVAEVGTNAFKGCSSLISVTLESKTTKLGADVFNGCKKLKTIKITSTKLTSKAVSKNAFKGLTKATTIKVPKKKLSAYKRLFESKGLSSKVKVKGY